MKACRWALLPVLNSGHSGAECETPLCRELLSFLLILSLTEGL